MAHNEVGLVVTYDSELGLTLPPSLEVADRRAASLSASYNEQAGALPSALSWVGEQVGAGVEGEGVVVLRGVRYRVHAPERPQVAGCLAMYGALKAKAALSVTNSDVRGRLLGEAKHALHTGRQLLAPFVASEPGYVLSAVDRGEGNAVQRHMSIGRRQRHEFVNGPFANTLSMLGRIAMVEGDTAGTARLGAAHDVFLAGSDKVGQTRNIMYMMLWERSQGMRVGRLGWNAFRLMGALGAATLRRQFGAWKVAAKMSKSLAGSGSAKRAIADYRMV